MGSGSSKKQAAAAQTEQRNAEQMKTSPTPSPVPSRSNQGIDVDDGRNSNVSNKSQPQVISPEPDQERALSGAQNSAGSNKSPMQVDSPDPAQSRKSNVSRITNRSQVPVASPEPTQSRKSNVSRRSEGSNRSQVPVASPEPAQSRKSNATRSSTGSKKRTPSKQQSTPVNQNNDEQIDDVLGNSDGESAQGDDHMDDTGGSHRSQSKAKARGSSLPSSASTPMPALVPRDQNSPITPTPSPHEHCSHCPHCQRLLTKRHKPKLTYPWITDNPGLGIPLIQMEKYDVDAVNAKLISEHGHLPGCYDYRPFLTIENVQEENERSGEVDCKETFVARKKKPITPARTPYPEFNVIERREQRLNKPYTQDLYVD